MAMQRTFRFETLRRLRKAREDDRKRIVAARLRTIATLGRQRDALESQVRQQTDVLREALTRPRAEIAGLRWGRHWVSRLRRQALEIEARIAEERALLAQERAELTAARKETKVMDRLKERQRELLMAEEARREQQDTDELNTVRFVFARIAAGDDES
ncbi:MAG: flagellar export protein FliJ [Phycisphaerae bacterium]